MRGLFVTLVMILSSVGMFAQYANDWIDLNGIYFKISVAEDGIYRINDSIFNKLGLDGVRGTDVRMYLRGEEIPVYVSTDDRFGSDDFVEFYGRKNRGEFDAELYEDADTEQLNPYYSLYTDTAVYFLTVSEVSGAGEPLRLKPYTFDLDNAPAPVANYRHERLVTYNDRAFDPRVASTVSFAKYSAGEGWGTFYSKTRTINMSTPRIVTDSTATLEYRFVTPNLVQQNIAVTFNDDTIQADVFFGTRFFAPTFDIESDRLKTFNRLRITGNGTNSNVSLASVLFKYSRQTQFNDFNELSFVAPPSQEESYYRWTHNIPTDQVLMYDLTNGYRVEAVNNDGFAHAVLPPSDSTRHLLALRQDSLLKTISFSQISTVVPFEDITELDPEYLVLSHSSLIGTPAFEDYIDYRSSASGGGYKVGVIDIQQVYDQFGYGLPKHPQSVRNFAEYINHVWPSLEMVFIIGKGVDYTLSRECTGTCASWFKVPTYGAPGADNQLFTLREDRVPIVPVGRIPVINEEEIGIYLDKVKEYEAVGDTTNYSYDNNRWTKNMIHLGGGRDQTEQGDIQSVLNDLEARITTSDYPVDLRGFYKTSTDGVGNADSEEIRQLLSDGTGLVTFLGHGSSSVLDYNVNNPSLWNNKGKYPIFNAMGCSAGQIHKNYRSLAEVFVFEPNGGSITFISGSGNQYLTSLGFWCNEWYKEIGASERGSTVGETVRNSSFALAPFSDFRVRILLEQNTITGDPAIPFYISEGPDLTFDPETAITSPTVINASLDSFLLDVNIVNLGRTYNEKVTLRIEQELPDGTLVFVGDTSVLINSASNQTTLTLPILDNSNGLNNIQLTIDPENLIDESPTSVAESNNKFTNRQGKVGIEVFIRTNTVEALQPLNYSIVTEEKPVLYAGTTDAFATGFDFIIQIDTVETFTSPGLYEASVEGIGGVLEYQPDLEWQDENVYYWRVANRSSSQGVEPAWSTSSFLYDPSLNPGWNQSHYQQIDDNDLENVRVDPGSRKLDLDGYNKLIFVQSTFTDITTEIVQFSIDGTNQSPFGTPWLNVDAHLFVAVIDTVIDNFVKNAPGGSFGAVNPFTNDRPVFPFKTDSVEHRRALMNFLQNEIQEGQFVVIYSSIRPAYPEFFPERWDEDGAETIYSVIENEAPGSNISALRERGSVPLVIIYQKGVGLISEEVAPNLNSTATAEFSYRVKEPEGFVKSTLIGPASNWGSLNWTASGLVLPESDSLLITYTAFSQDMSDSIQSIEYAESGAVPLETIDAGQYPFLRLTARVLDDSLKSAPNLDYWRVFYNGIADLSFVPKTTRPFPDTIPTGQTALFSTQVKNIGQSATEETELTLSITNSNNITTEELITVPALEPGEATDISLELTSLSNGSNLVVAEINRERVVLESTYLNNIGTETIFVAPDNAPPVLDVKFDGRTLRHLDFVSNSPNINISLSDPAGTLPVTNPEVFDVTLTLPDFTQIPVDVLGVEVQFNPASEVNPTAILLYQPTLNVAGIYKLEVIARDNNNNSSGTYEIDFQVSETPSLDSWTTFPNPTSQHLTFSFQLTSIPVGTVMELELIDMLGRVVGMREYDISSGTQSITLENLNLSAGVYTYRARVVDTSGEPVLANFGRTGVTVKDDAIIGQFVVLH